MYVFAKIIAISMCARCGYCVRLVNASASFARAVVCGFVQLLRIQPQVLA